jgi:hypothetical protein
MPCDISDSFKGGCQTVFGFKFLKSIFSSTLWTSFLITAIVILLLMILIPVESDTPVWLLFKFMFYTFLSIMGILVLHNGTLSINIQEEVSGGISKDLEDKLQNPTDVDPVNSSNTVEVRPKLGPEEALFRSYGIN